MKKITFNGQMRNEHFLIVMHHSSQAKAAVSGLRLCKLRNGVKKTPQFLLFSMEKVDQVRSDYLRSLRSYLN